MQTRHHRQVPTGSLVRSSGVIIGPLTYVSVALNKLACNLNVYVAQPDPTPTLHDGIAVVYAPDGLTTADMAVTAEGYPQPVVAYLHNGVIIKGCTAQRKAKKVAPSSSTASAS